jgi:hypothetical protein
MEENTIPITRPSSHVVPDVVKQVLEREGKIPKGDTQNFNEVPQQFVDKIKYPSEVIDLPSRGWFYPTGHPLSSGQIELKVMTAREEDILTSQNLIKKGVVLQKLLESLIVDKRIKQGDILLCDMNGIFVAIRRLAYGDQYGPLTIQCPGCGETKDHVIDLGSIHTKEFDFGKYPKGENSFTFELPQSKKTVIYKILTQREDDMVDQEIKNMAKVNKERSSEVTTRLKYVIQSIDGEDDKAEIRKVVDSLLSRDTLELRKHIKNNLPDLDMSFEFTCDNCNHSGQLDIPMTVQFFWPSS